MDDTQSSPLSFPCDFIIKVFGEASDEFEINVLTIIRKHIQELRENAIRTRYSKDKKYLALTITVYAESQEQLDEVYRELHTCPKVLMTL